MLFWRESVSKHGQSRYRTMRLWLVDLQAFHEPAILLRRQLSRFRLAARPLKTAAFQTLIQQQKSVSFPVQCLDAVSSSAAEEKQRIGERIQPELLLYDVGKPIYPAAQIRVSAGNIDLIGSGEITQHDRIADRMNCNVSASIPG